MGEFSRGEVGRDERDVMLAHWLRTLAAIATAVLVAGCPGIPNDGRYQDHDGGRSNTRADAAGVATTRPS
jgi:hypothetical protein